MAVGSTTEGAKEKYCVVLLLGASNSRLEGAKGHPSREERSAFLGPEHVQYAMEGGSDLNPVLALFFK
jgi:hypothetical protein